MRARAAELQGAPPRLRGERASEKDCQRTIVTAARLLDYRVMAIYPLPGGTGAWRSPVQGDAGYPDLTLVHRRAGVLWVELKRDPNVLEAPQAEWRDCLAEAGGVWRLVWVPEQLDAFLEELVQRSRS